MSRHADLTVRWYGSETALSVQDVHLPPHDYGRVPEVCRKAQSSPEKYVPDQEQRTGSVRPSSSTATMSNA